MRNPFGLETRLAWRILNRSRSSAVGAAAAFGVAIWANLVVWAIGFPLIVDPLPYSQADRIVRVWQSKVTAPGERFGSAFGQLLFWRERAQLADAIAAYGVPPRQLLLESSVPGEFEAVRNVPVSEGFFDVLRMPPLLGRIFHKDEQVLGPGVLVISHRYWQRRFGGDTNVVGRLIAQPGQRNSTVVGVMPATFDYPAGADVWMPAHIPKSLISDQNSRNLRIVARLRGDTSPEAFRKELLHLQSEAAKEFSAAEPNWTPIVEPLRMELFGDVRPTLFSLYAIGGLLVVLGFANVLTLMLVRARSRRLQFGIQIALGAPRRVVRNQLVLEGIILALGGWMAALLAAWLTLGLATAWLPPSFPKETMVIDSRLVWLSLSLSTVVGLTWGILTGAHIERAGVRHEILIARMVGQHEDVAGRQLRNAVMVCGIAMAVVVIIASAVAAREALRIQHAALGFRAQQVITARIEVSTHRLNEIYRSLPARLPKEHQVFVGNPPALSHGLSSSVFAHDLISEIRRIPVVNAAGMAGTMPLLDSPITALVARADVPSAALRQSDAAAVTAVVMDITEEYFHVLNIPLLTGRVFTDVDRLGTEPVAVVNQALARRLWGNRLPVGELMSQQREKGSIRIVGVVGDTVFSRPTEPALPIVYRPYAQSPPSSHRLLLSAGVGAEQLRRSIDAAARGVGAHVIDVRPMSEVIHAVTQPSRSTALALGLLALLALSLAYSGLHVTSAATLEFRQREFGIRQALGATPATISFLLLRHAAALATLGVALGLILYFVVSRLLSVVVPIPPVGVLPLVLSIGVVSGAVLLANVGTLIQSRRLNLVRLQQ